jgi:hypothetical protein
MNVATGEMSLLKEETSQKVKRSLNVPNQNPRCGTLVPKSRTTNRKL